MGKTIDLARISRKNSGQISPKTIFKKNLISRKFSRQMSLESDQFCADFTNVFIETKRKFCQLLLLLFFLEGGGEWWALACATTTTTGTSTTHKCCLFKTGYFVLKTPACFAISFALGIVSHKIFFFLSQIIICSFNNDELRNAPMAKLFISCTGHWPVPSFSQ